MACDTPIVVIDAGQMVKGTIYNDDVKVPCGKCPPCKRRRVSDWVFRLQEEDKSSSSSHFVTLTYNTKCIPLTKNGMMTLNKRDYQLFMKRLRKAQLKAHPNSPPIKYYMAGEYGEKRFRPHYHAIMFNVVDLAQIRTSWQMGEVDIGNVSGASIAYTCKYIDKPKRIPLHRNDDRKKEFSLMSKGLGHSFLTTEMIEYYQNDIRRYHVTTPNGTKIAMPKYYRKRIFNEDQIKLQTQHIQALLKSEEKSNEFAYDIKNPNTTYHEFMESGRRARYNSFYKTQIKRNHD